MRFDLQIWLWQERIENGRGRIKEGKWGRWSPPKFFRHSAAYVSLWAQLGLPRCCAACTVRAPQRISVKLAVILCNVPVRPRTCTGLHGWRHSASPSRLDSWSTTPAVIVDLGIGCSTYTTVHCRRPSVPRRRGTNKHGTVCQLKRRHQIPCKPSKPN